MGTIVVGGILLVVVVLIIRSLIKNKKNGKSSCGCDGGCGSCKGCH
jgi:hypothetical protein